MRFFATLVLSLTFACSVDVSKANVQCESNSDCTLVNAQNICDMCLDTALAFEENENLFDELSSARNFCLPADCEVTGAAICERNICTFVSFVELEA